MEIRRLTPEDGELLRTVRLRALTDAPSAFGSTYEREEAFTDDTWRHRLRLDGDPHFVCEGTDGAAVGIAAGVRDDTDPSVMHLMAMWVDPDARDRDGVVEVEMERGLEPGCRFVVEVSRRSDVPRQHR